MVRQRTLQLQRLEDRLTPANYNLPWHDPGHLSLSFVPDGTSIAGHASQLHSSLDGQFTRAAWQRTLLQAFQSWAEYANLNFAVRGDGGQALGTPGLMQGDPRFADIRIGAQPMTPEVLGISVPPDPALSGTWSGDVLLNSSYVFNGQPYSLLAVAMHEAGHALGLDNSDRLDDVMYTQYTTTRTTLSAQDVGRIQTLYGTRAADSYEGAQGNDTRDRAASFRLPHEFKGETPLIAFGDLTTRSDVDFFAFRSPDDGNDDQHDREMTIRVQTAGTSLLAPKFTVYDQFGRVLAIRTSSSVVGDTLQVRLTGLSSEQTYYVKVEAATSDVFAVGRYGLSVRFDKTSGTSDQLIDRLMRGPFDGLGADAIDAFFRASGDVLLNAEEGTNETPGQATPLTPVAGYNGSRYEGVASLAKQEDVDVYRITAPGWTAPVLTATVWTPDTTGFAPQIAVRDAAGQLVAAEVLANGNGTSTVQVRNAQPGATYFLQVTLNQAASQDKGNYLVHASFGERITAQRTFGNGTLSKTDVEDRTRLYVAQTQLFHFVLTTGGHDPGATIRLRLLNEAGAVVYTVQAQSGAAASGSSVLLKPGTYTAVFTIDNPNGPAVTYQLRGSSDSNPIGPVPSNTTLTPQFTSVENPGLYLYPGFALTPEPVTVPGFVVPNDPGTYPPGFVLPVEMINYPWLIAVADPYVWIDLGL